MPKSIRVDEPTYNRLAGLLRPRETFNDVVVRLLAVHDGAGHLLDALEGSIKFQMERSERKGGD